MTAPSTERATEWRRVHPLTPAVKSWQALVVLLIFFLQDFGQNAVRGAFGVGDDGGDRGAPGGIPDVGNQVFLIGGGIAVLALAVAVGLAVLSWRMTRFRVTDEALELHHGVLFRQQRRARLDRVQAVDVVQPLVARIFGLARLSLEVAGGGDSKIELAYLTHTQATELRNHLLAMAAGVRYDTPTAPEAPEHHWLEVPVTRLVASLVLSSTAASLVLIVVGVVVAVILLGNPGPIAFLFPTAIGFVSMSWNRFAGGFGFRVATSPDGLRLRHGLLEQRTQTVPPGRVQAVRLDQPFLWRRRDWWRVQVNVAGYGTSQGENRGDTESTLLPVGTRDEAVAVLAFVLPDLGVTAPEHPRLVVDAGLSGSGSPEGFVTSPRSARWLDPLGWRRCGFRVTAAALLLRRGVLSRHFVVVPHARTQSLGVTQGPIQRRLGLASFALHSTPGPIAPVAQHLATPVAARLMAEQAVRARQARAAAGPERWMERPEPAWSEQVWSEQGAVRAAEELAGPQTVDDAQL